MAAIEPVQFAASILSADFCRLGEQVEEALKAGIRLIHVDVMDGLFVPNLSMGPNIVKALQPLKNKYGAQIHAHLMIIDPDRYITNFVQAGADGIIVHIEACPHLLQTIRNIRSLGARTGVALNPATPLIMLEEILAEVDFTLIMSVEPGFGGQEFIQTSLDKIARLHKLLFHHHLEHVKIAVDGGIHLPIAASIVKAGAHTLVVGSEIFNSRASVSKNFQALCTEFINSR
ncbi:MAG: ribulose-phosphate 3-epimerase [Proteobacteria bacterium]|nr:ribulose-phosphate 3-epimerase [Pseudomonadota bacterium]